MCLALILILKTYLAKLSVFLNKDIPKRERKSSLLNGGIWWNVR